DLRGQCLKEMRVEGAEIAKEVGDALSRQVAVCAGAHHRGDLRVSARDRGVEISMVLVQFALPGRAQHEFGLVPGPYRTGVVGGVLGYRHGGAEFMRYVPGDNDSVGEPAGGRRVRA